MHIVATYVIPMALTDVLGNAVSFEENIYTIVLHIHVHFQTVVCFVHGMQIPDIRHPSVVTKSV